MASFLVLLHVGTEQIFRKYGEILGIDVNPNGFAFVQFNTVEEAKRACQVENGTMLHGKKIGE